jgi:hypothetical protein
MELYILVISPVYPTVCSRQLFSTAILTGVPRVHGLVSGDLRRLFCPSGRGLLLRSGSASLRSNGTFKM